MMLKKFFLEEQNIMMVIAVNAIVVFLIYFPEFENNTYLEIIDHIIVVIFLLEAVVKISVLKPRAYFSSGWNNFDFIIVLISLPSLLIYFVEIPNTSVLLILRMVRLVRLIRFLRFIPHIGMIISGLGRAIKASVFVLLALFFFNFLLALFACHFYGDLVPEYFGNPLISSYTMFQLFTIEGWNEIPESIAQKTDNLIIVGLSRTFFVIVVLLGGIFGMSFANAIFVDEMTMDNNRDLELKIDELQEQIKELKNLLGQNHK